MGHDAHGEPEMSQIVLYVASTEEAATAGATALGQSASDIVVEPTASLEAVQSRAPASDCVVFAETPTTAAGEHLLEVIDACDGTPLVLYTEASFGAAMARSTDGIDGYARRDGTASPVHLADEIRWVCKGHAESDGATDPDGGTMERLVRELQEVGNAGPIDDLCRRSLEVARSIMGFEWGAIYVGGQTGLDARVTVGNRLSPAGADDPALRALASTVVQRGERCSMDDILDHSAVSSEAVDVRSSVGAPIGRFGALLAVRDDPAGFSGADRDGLLVVAAILDQAIERRRATAELTDLQRRMQSLFEKVPHPVLRLVSTDDGATIEAVNEAFESVFGFDADEVRGESLEEILHPAGLDVEAFDYDRAIDGGTVENIEARRQTSDDVRDFKISLVPIAGTGRAFSIYRDVTERRRRKRKITAQRDRLNDIGDLIDGIRDPMNLASAYTEMAERTGDTEHYEEVQSAIDRMSEITRTIGLMTTELEVIIATEPVALHDIANRAWSTIDDEGATLEFGRDLLLEADKARMVDAFEVLFGNAIKHGTDDDSITVTVGATDSGFYVEDDGTGIPSNHYDRVFEPGFTTASDGTGYGLNLVDRVATAHGWTITITASASDGARFEFDGVTVPETVARGTPREAQR